LAHTKYRKDRDAADNIMSRELYEEIRGVIEVYDYAKARHLLKTQGTGLTHIERLRLQFMLSEEIGDADRVVGVVASALSTKADFLPPLRSLDWVCSSIAKRGRYHLGLEFIDALCQNNKQSFPLIEQRIRFFALTRSFQLAIDLIHSSWPQIPKPKRAEFGILEARLLLLLGQPDQALQKFVQFLRRPNGKQLFYDRAARLAFRLNDIALAQHFVNLSIQMFGGDAERHLLLAGFFKNSCNWQGAIQNATQALALLKAQNIDQSDAHRRCHELLVTSRLARRNFSPALTFLLEYLETDNTWIRGKAYVMECYLAMRNIEKAEEVLNELLEQAPASPEVLASQYMFHMEFGESAVADGALNALTTRHSDHASTKQMLAMTLRSSKVDFWDKLSNLRMPAEFSPKWTEQDLRSEGPVLKGLQGHLRSVVALILREFRTRFVRYKLGFLWIFLEPSVHTMLFVLIFSVLNKDAVYGMSTPLFIVTGIIPYQLFATSFGQMISAVRSNKDLFMHSRVQVVDVFVARGVLECLVAIVVFLCFLLALNFIGDDIHIEDPLVVLGGFLGLLSCGVGIGLITASIGTILPGIATMIQHSTKILFFTSGVFFAPEMFPAELRDMFLINPLLHFIGMIRSNFTAALGYENVDFMYAFICALTFLSVGFIFERVHRFRLLNQ
jgi:capsular polysaccharide transport system permease protein